MKNLRALIFALVLGLLAGCATCQRDTKPPLAGTTQLDEPKQETWYEGFLGWLIGNALNNLVSWL